jgi:hypothetical protein
MKPDQNYINRLEVGDTIRTDRGETVRVNNIDRWGNINCGTTGNGISYLRIFDKTGSGSPSSGNIETP